MTSLMRTFLTNVLNSVLACFSFSLLLPQQQIVQYLKDMFDHDKVRFTSAQSLAEDLLSLSHRRSDILLGYLGIVSLLEPYPKEMQPAPACPTTPKTWVVFSRG